MSTADPNGPAATAAPATAGRLLREARERQGLHIAALAASIKVPPKKLEALENDRYDELPDATFCRALAQTVCRALKVDAAPVLALLPRGGAHRLEQVSEGLNTPFRERHAARLQAEGGEFLKNPTPWIVLAVLLAALVVWLWPSALTRWAGSGRAGASSASGAAGPIGAGSAGAMSGVPLFPPADGAFGATLPREVEVVPPGAPAVAASTASSPEAAPAAVPVANPSRAEAPASVVAATPAAAASGILVLRTSAPSWVEVVDARGQPVLTRLLQSGDAVGLDAAPPLRLRIGNAAATELSFRGRAMPLAPYTRDNVARLELR